MKRKIADNNQRAGSTYWQWPISFLFCWMLGAQQAKAVLIEAGQTFTFKFSDLSFVEERPGEAESGELALGFALNYTTIVLPDGTIQIVPIPEDSLLNMDLYEDSDSVAPFWSVRDSGVGIGNFFGLGVQDLTGIQSLLGWDDLNGKLVIWPSSGEFELGGIDITVLTQERLYSNNFRSFSVPQPSLTLLLGTGLLMWTAARMKLPRRQCKVV